MEPHWKISEARLKLTMRAIVELQVSHRVHVGYVGNLETVDVHGSFCDRYHDTSLPPLNQRVSFCGVHRHSSTLEKARGHGD